MGGGGFGGSVQRRENMCGRGQIGVADTEADDVNALLLDLSFEAVEFREKIRRLKGKPRARLFFQPHKTYPCQLTAYFIIHFVTRPKTTAQRLRTSSNS